MVKMIQEKITTTITKERVVLQITEEQFDEQIRDEMLGIQIGNVEDFVLQQTKKTGFEIVDVRYKDNSIDTGIIEIEAEREEKVTVTEEINI